MARFELVQGEAEGTAWPFTDRISIGRDDANDIVTVDQEASRRHAIVTRRGGLMLLTDLDSSNGTFLNSVRIQESVLRDGDEVRIGCMTLKFVSDRREEAAESVATLFGTTGSGSAVQTRTVLDATLDTVETPAAVGAEDVEQLRAALARERTVSHVNDALGTLTDLRELFERMLELVFDVLPADRGVVLLRDPKTGTFDVEAVRTRDPSVQIPPRASRTLIAKVCEEKVAVLSSDARDDHRFDAGVSIIDQGIRSVMCVPLVRDETVLGVIHVDTEVQTGAFCEEDLRMLTQIAHAGAIAVQNALRYRENKALFHQTIRALAGAIDLRDPYTAGHSERVATFSRAIAVEMGLAKEECEQIYLAGILHDTGKLGIPDEILRKPGKLNDSEYQQFKIHPSEGARIIATIEQMSDVTEGVAQHHEKVDGTGYPGGLAKAEISRAARILAVADTFDAMTSDRPYRNRLPDEVAFEELERFSSRQFDPDVVDAFLRAYKSGKISSEEQ